MAKERKITLGEFDEQTGRLDSLLINPGVAGRLSVDEPLVVKSGDIEALGLDEALKEAVYKRDADDMEAMGADDGYSEAMAYKDQVYKAQLAAGKTEDEAIKIAEKAFELKY